MEWNGNQRKRGGRTSKNANTSKKSEHNDVVENSAVAISPTLEEPEGATCAPASECRRSSRKKIIKFDVRDLLNKNRKTHKIQIEARIDSNAPSTSKGATGDVSFATSACSSSASKEDLLSKHKTFLEKSAIFRRYSISQEQKPPPPLPIPPLLGKSTEINDSSFSGTSCSQEFFSKALIKPKQPTSLIVAQIESNKPACLNTSKRKGLEVKAIPVSKSDTSPIARQKKRGRPAKIKHQTAAENTMPNITPEKATNWKEYKACLAQQSSSSNEEENISKIKAKTILKLPQQRNQRGSQSRGSDNINDFLQSDVSRSDDDGSFSGFQINKEDISCDSPVLEKKVSQEINDDVSRNDVILQVEAETIEKVKTFGTSLNKNSGNCDEHKIQFSEERGNQQITEAPNIKPSDSYNSNVSMVDDSDIPKTTAVKDIELKADTQKIKIDEYTVKESENIAAENKQTPSDANKYIANIEIVSDECIKGQELLTLTSETDIVSRDEKTSRNVQEVENKTNEKDKCVEKTKVDVEDLYMEPNCSRETGKKRNSPKIVEESKKQTKVDEEPIFAITNEMDLSQSSLPSYQNNLYSRTSSSSESENSIYSSEPFSRTSSSPCSYKSGDIVKVSIKDFSLSKSPSTSQTSTFQELSNIAKGKSMEAKGSKSLRKKLDSLHTENENLEISIEKEAAFASKESSVEDNRSKSSENHPKEYSSDVFLKLCEESTNKSYTHISESSSTDSEIRRKETNMPLNEDRLEVLGKNINRKSLRNRRNCSSYNDKSQFFEKTECDEVQKSLVREITKELGPFSNEIEKVEDNDESSREKSICNEKKCIPAKYAAKDQSSQILTEQNETTIDKSTTHEKETIKDEAGIGELVNVSNDKAKQKNAELHMEDVINKINETDFVVKRSEAEITKSKIYLKPEITTPFEQRQQSNFKKDEKLLNFTVRNRSESQACKKVNADSKDYVLGSQDNSKSSDNTPGILSKDSIITTRRKIKIIEGGLDNMEKVEPSKCKSTKQELENNFIFPQSTTEQGNFYGKSSKTTEEKTFQLAEEAYFTSPNSSDKNTATNNEIFQVEIGEKPIETKSPIQNISRELLEDLIFQDKKDVHVGTKKISSIIANDRNKKPRTEIKTNIHMLSDKTAEEGSAEISTGNSTVQKEKINFEGTEESREHEKQCLTPEIIKSQNSKCAQVNTRIKLIESKGSTEKLNKTITIDTAAKEEILKEISPSNLDTQLEIIKRGETSLKNNAYEESNLAENVENVEETKKSLVNFKATVEHAVDELPQYLKDTNSFNSHSPLEISPETPSDNSFTGTILLKHSESTQNSSVLDEIIQVIEETSGPEKILNDNVTSVAQQENKSPDSKKQLCVPEPVSIRRGRKPRFKNLYGTEDSEPENSNEKIALINKVIQEKLEGLEENNEVEEIELKKKDECVDARKDTAGVPEDSASNLSTSQIKNVSIETNTLLDILRTVQSNTAAALKANKSPADIKKTDTEHTVNSTSNAKIDELSKHSQDLIKNQQKIRTSPILFDTASASTAKKFNLSPERSNSNSPLAIKKIAASPSRSNSASPLTLKKITRRYERRSRRDEDSSHKTLEETFAEIAAQSSKAVLAAKEYEDKPPEELGVTINSDINVKDQVKENWENLEKISAPLEIDLHIDRYKKFEKDLVNIARNAEKETIELGKLSDDPKENIVGVETTKITPARRGRKPKNRASALSAVTTEESIIAKCIEELRDESKDTYVKVDTEEKLLEERGGNKHDSENTNELFETSSIEHLPDCEEKTLSAMKTHPKETELETFPSKPVDDMNKNKPTKKANNKRVAKNEAEEDNSSVSTCHENSGEVRTPKQQIKKRDSSLTKSETKTLLRKGQKKTKNEEEGSLILLTEDSLIKNTSIVQPFPKRGRRPKSQQQDALQGGSKKKTKKDSCTTNDRDDIAEEKVKYCENECDSSLDKLLDEKLAKKTRQRKLKEAFEAALTDKKEEGTETSKTGVKSLNFDLNLFNNSPPPDRESFSEENQTETIKSVCLTPVEAEDEPDPLKDIEKFIADGVNLLKKDYKLDENSVDDIQTTSIAAAEIVEDPAIMINDDVKLIFNTFETPADTPINTPSVTPPPRSPSSLEPTTPDENFGVRRSHRIKLITKTPKALVGRGLVRDRERFSIKDDVETKSHYSLDDHLTDLAEVEAKNAKFLKEMEERLSNFQVIKENEYLCERVISREAKKMICDCFLTHEEEYRGELGCGEDCLNRLLMIECGSECNVKERCTNKRFQKLLCSPCRVFRTEKKGFGIMADIEILPGEFIMEYVGEVINTEEFEKRRVMYSQEKNRHYYFMALRSDAIIDATIKGNISRFINHSCDPNAETQKWTVNGELRIGFFSRKSIMPGEEITFNYQYQRYGREAQRCYCESTNCTGWIGQEPTSDEGEQIDDEDDETEDEEEEAVTTNLLVQDDEDDSDASVADPEEVQKCLERAAAQAEAELAPLQLIQERGKQVQQTSDDKTLQDLNKTDNEEDSKSKFKKLLSKMAAKQKQSKREQKLQRKNKSKESSSELTKKLKFLEDPDIENEVQFLKECGLKNQSDTLRLSRLMVRAKLVQTRLNLLEVLRKGEFPCRRLFLDYHGLRLLHGWMSEDAGNMQIRLSLLQTLQTLPIANKTVLTDSKVMQVVRTWSGPNNNLSPNEDSSGSNSSSQDPHVQGATTLEESSEIGELQKLASELNTAWEGLPEIFRIPKKERIEQMKEHEREADRQYAANAEIQENIAASNRYGRDRFGRGLYTPNNGTSTSNRFIKPNSGNPHKTVSATPENLKNLSKAQRRELFAAKVARDEAEKRLAEERREYETKCRFFGLDPKKTRSLDMPFCVNPATGQWFSIERKAIITPPSYAHVQVPIKTKSTNPNDYQLPAVCGTLPPQWKYAITPQGKIYFYHIKQRQPQWEPPSLIQLQQYELEAKEEESESDIISTAGEDSSDDDDDILIGMDAVQLKAYINRKVEMRRQKRYQRLVDERSISPRREEDRIYNQIEVRKYKENKEKIRKRKEDIRRKRAEALRQSSLNMCTLGNMVDVKPTSSKFNIESDEESKILPIQDYLLSSDEEADIKTEVNSPLIDKIVEGDKIVDELDALTTKRQLKRALPPHRGDLCELPTSSSSSTLVAPNIAAKQEYKQEYKKRKLEKKEKKKPKEQDAKYRKTKEKFRCEIAGIIVHHLKPYLKETCILGRIQSNEDFNHLARKLTHFVMIKELKYCESVGQTLVVTESVKSKSREFIKKYMAKYGDVYVKPTNDPDFKDIPFTL